MEITPENRTAYAQYLQSSDWRIRRNRALREACYRCFKCGGKSSLEVHHLSYERLGREWDQDLVVLCADCHHHHHVAKALESPARGVFVKLAIEALKAEPWDSIASLSDAIKRRCATLKINYDRHEVDEALRLVAGRLSVKAPPTVMETGANRVMPDSRPPCGCVACVAAGASQLRVQCDPDTGLWMHGETLRRWHEARQNCRRAFADASRRHGMPSSSSFVWMQQEDERFI